MNPAPARPAPQSETSSPTWRTTALGLRTVLALAGIALLAPRAAATTPLVQLNATTYQTEHCLFVIDASVTWAVPTTAYNDLFGGPFTRLSGYYDTLTTAFPGTYFSICYIAATGASPVPNYIDRIFKANGINEPGTAGAPQSFATVDFCRYNLGGFVQVPALAVYDHELGHAWGAQVFNSVSGVGPGILANGHWVANSTVDCQLGAVYSPDGGATLDKIYGDPVHGFRYQRVDNLQSNDYETFSEQELYLMGVRESFPTTYVLNGPSNGAGGVLNPTYNADGTVSYTTLETYDHAALVARYGARSPDYTSSPKHFHLGFVYVARDLAEVNSVYQAVEQSIVQFTTGEVIDPVHYRFQTPFLVDAHYKATVDARLADLDGNTTPTLAVTTGYVTSADGNAVVSFTAADPAGPAPTVSVVPATAQGAVGAGSVTVSALPDGVHFYTLKAANAAGKVAFAHFVVEVHRPVTATSITTQPLTQTVLSGAVAAFSVAATGTPATFTYQWYRMPARTSTWTQLADGGAYNGSTTATLSVTSSTAMNGDQFLCLATNSAGTATSTAAALVVNESGPVFTAQPADKTVSVNSAASFSIAVAGPPTSYGYFTYQWQRQSFGSGTWTDLANGVGVSGAQSAGLTLSALTLPMSGDQVRCVVTNTAGSTISNIATLTVGQPPSVTTQPQSVSSAAGSTVMFTVVAAGTAPLTYQWELYGVNVAGANSATLTLSNIQPSNAGAYTIYITNALGATRSNVATLTVTGAGAPSITAQPQNATVVAGTTANFGVTATGTAPLGYQWRKNGTNIGGATSATYAIASTQPSDAGTYSVVVSNSAGSAISGNATLTVTAAPPAITTQPTGASVLTGASVSFTVAASGTAPLTYQWSRNGTPIGGATSATYAIASVALADAGSYTVVVTNGVGSATSAAAVLVVNAIAPTITSPPAGLSVTAGSPAAFSVAASGTTPFTYQWFKNGSAIGGATTSSYTIASAQAADAANYTVSIGNSAGNATSSPATLTVTALTIAPTITIPPASASVLVGAGVTFSVTAGGTAPFTYQWQLNGAPIFGATAASYVLASAQLTDAGAYTVTVTNGAGSATSAAAGLTVSATPPTILTAPQNATVLAGGGVTFSVAAGGTAPFTYQWRKNGAAIGGATSAGYTIPAAQAADTGSYDVVITNAAGSVTSAAATLTVTVLAVAPAITTPPQPVTVVAGAGAGFTVLVSGTSPFSYQWLRNGTPLAGATAATYTLAAAQPADSGSYAVTVSNSAGFVTSAAATLTVSAAPPTIVSPPQNATAQAGGSVTFTVTPGGTPPFTYQWSHNGVAVGGATAASFTLGAVASADAGSYTVTVTNAAGSITCAAATLTVVSAGQLPTSVLSALSVRTALAPGQQVIPGFVTNGPKPLLLRVAGPALTALNLGLTGIPDPQLDLYDQSSRLLGRSTGWDPSLGTLFSSLGASPFAVGSRDVATVATLDQLHSAIVSGTGNGTALVEVYDAQVDYAVRLVDISARNQVGTGNDVLIVGFVIAGTGTKRVLIRGIGPGLAQFKVGGFLADPVLDLYDSAGARINGNDNWSATLVPVFTQVGAFALDHGSADAALLVTLPPGIYTAVLSGKNQGTGQGLVEVYEVWP